MNHSVLISLGSLVLIATCRAQKLTWTQIKPTNSPSPRYSHAMAYDSARQRTVLFGGWTSRYIRNDTWEWDGRNWTLIKPTNSPSIRYAHAMAYDSARRRTVLFGGGGRNGHLADTWEWDGKNWALIKPTNSPSGRSSHAMAYDAARKRVVLFGGVRGGALGETWEWDGKNWTQSKPLSSPSARWHHAMVYDAARQRTVLFGGHGMADTWVWDGKNWTLIKPTNSPSIRYSHAMAYDSARRLTVLFGGRGTGGFPELGDTWEWDGKNWTLMKSVSSPAPRAAHTMAYDAARQRTVLFGGYDKAYSNILGETWEWDGVVLTLTTDISKVSLTTGGVQKLILDAGAPHGKRLYWIFGSVTGTRPGVNLASAAGTVNIPLNPDIWTGFTIAFANSSTLVNTKAALDVSGGATASIKVPQINLPSAIGVVFYHAYLVYDANSNYFLGSNPVTLTLVK
jgi:Galactose oxidase, central domain